MKNNQNSQLFTELTPEEGSNVSGGLGLGFPKPRFYAYNIYNKSGIDVNFTFGGKKTTLGAGKEQTYINLKPYVNVQYDEIIGPGYEVETRTLKAGGKNSFDRNGVRLILTDKVNANLV